MLGHKANAEGFVGRHSRRFKSPDRKVEAEAEVEVEEMRYKKGTSEYLMRRDRFIP